MRVGIVGAGLAGLSCGYELQKQGVDVVLLSESPMWAVERPRDKAASNQ